MESLKNKNYLDNNFLITDNNFYMVFLGDYVDEGNYSVEVLYTVLRLKISNPNNVFLLRGHHEDLKINQEMGNQGFKKELDTKFPGKNMLNNLAHVYDLMPVVLYVGSDNEFILCAHGGIELGYKPNQLIDSPKNKIFEWLGMLTRKTIAQEGIFKNLGRSNVELIFYYEMKYNTKDFLPQSVEQLGFLWNDFQPNETYGASLNQEDDIGLRGFAPGKELTQRLLQFYSSANKEIKAVFRAHQHDYEKPDTKFSKNLPLMIDLIINGNGVAKIWKSDQKGGEPLWQNMVVTFNASPDTIYGKTKKYTYDTYAILTIGKKFPDDWQLEINNLVTIK